MLEIEPMFVPEPGSGFLCPRVDSPHAFIVFRPVCQLQVGKEGKVVGIDYIPELVDLSVENTRKHHRDKLAMGNLVLKVGDGWKGSPEDGPFDSIHVGAAATFVPPALLDQVCRKIVSKRLSATSGF
jgi:Protein-L-isoaspartate(D-aspartate) O-methyltransferase (PCMT)